MSVIDYIKNKLDVIRYGGKEVKDHKIKGLIRYPLRIKVESHSNGNATFYVMRKDVKIGRFCKPARPGWGWSYLAANVYYDNWDCGEFYDAEDMRFISDRLDKLNSQRNMRDV